MTFFFCRPFFAVRVSFHKVTQVDLVQSQIRIAAGATLKELGLVQKNVKVAGVAMQCRVTTEDPSQVYTEAYVKGVECRGWGVIFITNIFAFLMSD